ncbi:MAG TPA: hypothetical protein VF101_08045 [Gaiellaceae bacterium]
MQPRYLSGYGLVGRGLDKCVERLAGAKIAKRSVLEARGWALRDEAIAYLDHLTFPATRLVLFAVNEQWTAVLTNARDGSDFNDHQLFFGELCDARTCRVVDREPRRGTANGYRYRLGYAARIFELDGPDGENLRTIYAMDDGGRWDFPAVGDQPLVVESTFDYGARRKSDRFTSENVRAVLASLGVEPPVPEAFERADRFLLLHERMTSRRWARRIEADASTPEEQDDPARGYIERGLDWVPHMRTHASSVVVDLTKAVLLNPDHAASAEPHLRKARRRLGDEEFERLAAAAEEDLGRRGG